MSQEREAVRVGTPENNPPELSRQQRKAKIVSVLERGLTGDRLQVDLPPELTGEWVSKSKLEIYRMEGLGYKVDTEYAVKNKLHDQGDGSSVIGDVIYMTTTKENKELINETILEMMDQAHNPKRQREDTEHTNVIDRIGMPVIKTSRAEIVNSEQIKATITSGQK